MHFCAKHEFSKLYKIHWYENRKLEIETFMKLIIKLFSCTPIWTQNPGHETNPTVIVIHLHNEDRAYNDLSKLSGKHFKMIFTDCKKYINNFNQLSMHRSDDNSLIVRCKPIGLVSNTLTATYGIDDISSLNYKMLSA